MLRFTKTVHVLALGLWFGTVIFFTFVVGISLFENFWSLAQQEQRPLWFPRPPQFDRDPPSWPGEVEPLLFKDRLAVQREQGGRVAGSAVSPLFDWYFLIQGVCGLLAVVTALGWSRADPQDRVHRIRVWVLLLALVTVVGGWPLERKVRELRTIRNDSVDAVLESDTPSVEALRTAAGNASDFGLWHTISLFVNFGTVVLVTVAMALAARLPADNRTPAATRAAGRGQESAVGAAS
jgi:hypothetical protein